MKKFILLLVFISYSSFAAQDICIEDYKNVKGIRFQTGNFGSGRCFISLSSNYIKDMVYRSYLITSKGQLMVFNSFGNGPGSTHTGARVFHFFPYRSKVTWNLTEDYLEVTLNTGAIARFELEEAGLVEITSAKVDVGEVDRSNNGGVEITAVEDIIMDSGFRMGGSPVWKLNRNSTLFDGHGNSCTVRNSKVFEKKGDEVYLTIDSNNSLDKFLRRSCPDIQK